MEKLFYFFRKCLLAAGLLMVCGSALADERAFGVMSAGFGEDVLAGLVWDATRLERIAEGTGNRIDFFEDGNVAECLDGFSRFYTQRGDSVFFRGFSAGRHTAFVARELPQWCMDTDSTRTVALTLAGNDHGIEMVLSDAVCIERPLRGVFVRAFDDSLRNVAMVRERHCVVERFATGDSIQSYDYDICRWFAAGDRLPFAIQYNTTDSDEARLYVSSIEISAPDSTEDGISEQEIAAILGADADPDEDFSTRYSYDAIGRPTAMKRNGVVGFENGAERFGIRDDLLYTYSGAVLSQITASPRLTQGYNPINTAVGTYRYNAGGGLAYDSSRGITAITYNHLGQPINTTASDARRIYSAANTYTSQGTPALSPWTFAAANPVRYCDPTGLDWKYVTNYKFDDDMNLVSYQTIEYTDCSSQEEMDKNKEIGVYIDAIVIVLDGSQNERLGKKNGRNGYIDGEGAIAADVTVYGDDGPDDIGKYTGFTMTSDFNKYGAVADGTYSLEWRNWAGTGSIPKHYYIKNKNKEKGDKLPTIDGNRNPGPDRCNEFEKDKTFIHRTNLTGNYAGDPVSTGCPIILASQWDRFEKQVGTNYQELKPFATVIIRRQ